mgnify:CR=1 FL=1
MSLTVHPLDSHRLADLDAVFQARGCSVARSCYCIYYRVTNREYQQLEGDRKSVV